LDSERLFLSGQLLGRRLACGGKGLLLDRGGIDGRHKSLEGVVLTSEGGCLRLDHLGDVGVVERGEVRGELDHLRRQARRLLLADPKLNEQVAEGGGCIEGGLARLTDLGRSGGSPLVDGAGPSSKDGVRLGDGLVEIRRSIERGLERRSDGQRDGRRHPSAVLESRSAERLQTLGGGSDGRIDLSSDLLTEASEAGMDVNDARSNCDCHASPPHLHEPAKPFARRLPGRHWCVDGGTRHLDPLTRLGPLLAVDGLSDDIPAVDHFDEVGNQMLDS
jgi:hypothetical protein